MNKKIYIIISIIVLVIGGITIYFLTQKDVNTPNNNNNQSQSLISENKFEAFKEKLQNSGYEITGEVKKAAELVGAQEGYSYEINGSNIEIYKFNLNSSEELTKSNLKSAKNEGKIYMPSFNNYSIEVKINNNLVLTSYSNHPDKDKIIKLFNEL